MTVTLSVLLFISVVFNVVQAAFHVIVREDRSDMEKHIYEAWAEQRDRELREFQAELRKARESIAAL